MLQTTPSIGGHQPSRTDGESGLGEHLLELVISWEDVVLDVVHTDPGGTCSAIPELGAFRARVQSDGLEAQLFLPEEARVDECDAKAEGLDSWALQVDSASRTRRVQLGLGHVLTWKLGALSHTARLVLPSSGVIRQGSDWTHRRFVAVSALLHGVFAAAATMSPRTTPPIERFENQVPISTRMALPESQEPIHPPDSTPTSSKARTKHRRTKVRKRAADTRESFIQALGLLRAERGLTRGSSGGGFGSGFDRAVASLEASSLDGGGPPQGSGPRRTGAGDGGSLGLGALRMPGQGPAPSLKRGRSELKLGRTLLCGRPADEGRPCGLSKEEIARVLRRNLPRFKHCYERELNAHPTLDGRVVLSFLILPSGAVAQTEVSTSTLEHAPTEDCLRKVAASLRLPKPRGGQAVEVRYPFVFNRI
ncbi:MAG: AgmX/PglI C-terminal domain-containing protein [Myxococcota bacterium]